MYLVMSMVAQCSCRDIGEEAWWSYTDAGVWGYVEVPYHRLTITDSPDDYDMGLLKDMIVIVEGMIYVKGRGTLYARNKLLVNTLFRKAGSNSFEHVLDTVKYDVSVDYQYSNVTYIGIPLYLLIFLGRNGLLKFYSSFMSFTVDASGKYFAIDAYWGKSDIPYVGSIDLILEINDVADDVNSYEAGYRISRLCVCYHERYMDSFQMLPMVIASKMLSL